MSVINEDRTIWELPVTSTVNLSDLIVLVNEGETKHASIQQLEDIGYQGTDLKSLSANWQNTFTVVTSNSANWNSVFTVVTSNSANYILQNGNSQNQHISIGTNDNYHLNFRTAGTNKMIVLSSGNVGINTDNPNEYLTINGNVSSLGTYYSTDNSNNTHIGLNIENQNVGNNATAKIQLNTDVGGGGVWLQSFSNTQHGGQGSLNVGHTGAYPLGFVTNNQSRMSIDASGNVGINTTNFNEKLNIEGNVEISNTNDPAFLRINERQGNAVWELRTYHTNLGAPFDQFSIWGGSNQSWNGPFTDRFVISPTGDVGIGVTNPIAKLEVDGDICIPNKIFQRSDPNTDISFPLNSTFAIKTNGDERLRVTSNGRVGINTTTPNEMFTVVGNISATNTPKWDSAYTTVQNTSATWVSTYNTVKSLSATWQPFMINCTDEFTNFNANSLIPIYTFAMPYAMKLSEVRAFVTTPAVGGGLSPLVIDIRHNGSSIFSTKLHIDNSSNTSVGSITPSVILPSFSLGGVGLTDDAIMGVYIESVGSVTPGSGLKILFK